ncbi:DUF6011 domain-containing protein [Streptomyces sp. NPDC059761]|uniref:DUF6011 domain-containing protein n=1 Tax=Streptomyces sp. NPDC059761 TaxID=3346937 RepID=UPI003649F6F7
MAFRLSKPLVLVGYDESGRPDFGLGSSTIRPTTPPQAASKERFVATAAELTEAAKTIGVNKYGGSCFQPDCGAYVAAGEGQRIKLRDSWLVRHVPGKCPASSAAIAPLPRQVPVEKPGDVPSATAVLTGYFTAQFGDDQSDYVTLRIRRQPEDSTFKPGELIISYLRGRNNEDDYTKFANVDSQGRPRVWKSYVENSRLNAALAAVLGDQRGAGETWARASKRCWRCGRLLTTPESLDRLLGEECAHKM